MVTPEEARDRIGDGVIYTPINIAAGQIADVVFTPNGMGGGEWILKVEGEHLKAEDGVITSANDKYIFVRFAGDTHSKACAPENLRFLS